MPNKTTELDAHTLAEFISQYSRIAVLSGAGCSTASGIPDYRNDDGEWKHRRPMQFNDFVSRSDSRRRYWAQSFSGWQKFSVAQPNAAHAALSDLETNGLVNVVVTQNVDNLHRRAGSKNVIDLHGILDEVLCLACDEKFPRVTFQERLRLANPEWTASIAGVAPDGDARITRDDFSSFTVPACENCDGTLKPNVVFFGEQVPAGRVARASEEIGNAEALLIVGSSLMVFSGFRFARDASKAGLPVAIVNRGVTRADELASLRLHGDCASVLTQANRLLVA